MIEQMRNDFADAAAWEEWPVEEQEEVGAVIRAAIAANDEEALSYWAWRLASAAEQWRRWRSRVREVEAKARASAQKARDA